MNIVTIGVTLTVQQEAALKRFLSRVRYGDVYKHVEHAGDGNKAGSESDREVRETLDAINVLKAAIA